MPRTLVVPDRFVGPFQEQTAELFRLPAGQGGAPGDLRPFRRRKFLSASLAALLTALASQLNRRGILAFVWVRLWLIGRGEVHQGLGTLVHVGRELLLLRHHLPAYGWEQDRNAQP